MILLGKNIKNLRKKQHLSQSELSEKLGLSQTTVAHYESGTRQPTIETLIKLSHLFQVTIDDLVGNYFRSENSIEINGVDEVIEKLVGFLVMKKESDFLKFFNDYVIKEYHQIYIFQNILATVLYEIGNMWENGKISEADEHYATNIVRKALISVSSANSQEIKYKKAISLSVSSEQHTIGIEMVSIILESLGVETLYLGTNVTSKSIMKLMEDYQPDYLLISVTMSDNLNRLNDFISILNAYNKIGKVKIIIGGNGINSLDDIDLKHPNIQVFNRVDQLFKYISSSL